MSDSKELAGKVAVVTGAGRNIGRAIALALAQGGAAVVVNTRSNRSEADSVVREIEAAGGKAVAVLGDVADAATAQALADAALKAFGRIDILVNNAALRRENPIDEISYEEWRDVMDVILDSAFRCVKACLPALKKQGGTIINIGGMSAHIGSKHRTILPATTLPPIAWCRGQSRPRVRPRRPSLRTISRTAPSAESAASRRTWRRWCGFSWAPARATSPVRRSRSAAVRFSGEDGARRYPPRNSRATSGSSSSSLPGAALASWPDTST
jgi:NAD(P)-dependent dehydrogenase (short-subunit alcohol dehydrogenase family)